MTFHKKVTIWLLAALLAFAASCKNDTGKADFEKAMQQPMATPSSISNAPKIVAFGDSLTAGFGLTENESYPYLLQEKLKADGLNYVVVNAGVSGDTSAGGLDRLDWVLGMDNVKILILELGANDMMRGVKPAEVRSNLDTMIRRAKAKNIEVLLCGMFAPPTSGEDYSREFNEIFPKLAHEHDLTFLPFLLEGIALKKELNQPDGIHPNAEGERMMTDNVYRALRPMLAK